MTINKTDEPDLRSDEDNASNRLQHGFADPAGQFPRSNYVFESSLNQASRGSARNTLSTGGGIDGVSVELPPMQESKYPNNQVWETTSGHVMEFDDTPGGERILIKHNSGSGIEIRADGSMVMKTETNMVQSIAGSSCLIVEGEAEMVFSGNLSLKVAGDLNLNVGGNINTNVGGNKSETINGASRETVYGARGSVVRGSRSETTVGTTTQTYLSGLNEIVKGDNRRSIQGDATWGVSGTLKQTAEGEMIISSDNINIGAQNLSVFGASGTIGGDNIVHYGVTYYGTTFYGDLVGTAEQAITSDVTNSQNYPDTGAHGDEGIAVGFSVDDDGSSSASASSSMMNSYLNQSANGSMKIQIDEGDFIRNIVDRSTENDGISDRPMSTREVRSALRDPSNMSNSTFTGNAFSSGKISSTYANTVPSGIGRLASATPQTRTPIQPSNSNLSRINRYSSSKNTDVTTFTPDPKYNVNDISTTTPITGQIELSPGIRLARFLGAVGDRVTLAHVSTREEKLQIARQFVMHASAVNTILNNRGEFKDHRLVVVEGLYKPGLGETLTAGSTNDRATRGETVVYELHDETGTIDSEKTYDLALWWKDSLNFDKISLSYDTFNSDGSITAQIILTMPELDSDYNLVNRYKNEIETLYNNNSQGNELIEVTA